MEKWAWRLRRGEMVGQVLAGEDVDGGDKGVKCAGVGDGADAGA